MADRMIEMTITEIKTAPPETRAVLASATVTPKIAASMLRALADELDPPKPVLRSHAEKLRAGAVELRRSAALESETPA